jgi:hypothetical protein
MTTTAYVPLRLAEMAKRQPTKALSLCTNSNPILRYRVLSLQLIWNLLGFPKIVKCPSDGLVRVPVTRVSKLSGFGEAESRAPSPLENPILVLPGSCIPGRLRLGQTGFVANLVPDLSLVLRPLNEAELLL